MVLVLIAPLLFWESYPLENMCCRLLQLISKDISSTTLQSEGWGGNSSKEAESWWHSGDVYRVSAKKNWIWKWWESCRAYQWCTAESTLGRDLWSTWCLRLLVLAAVWNRAGLSSFPRFRSATIHHNVWVNKQVSTFQMGGGGAIKKLFQCLL